MSLQSTLSLRRRLCARSIGISYLSSCYFNFAPLSIGESHESKTLHLRVLLTHISINIGNARIQGLEADLNMTGNDWNIVLFLFFIPYILLEAPSNVLLKRLRPSLFLPAICCGWSLCTTLQGVTTSFAGLVVCRVLIGVFEAGLFPGKQFYSSPT